MKMKTNLKIDLIGFDDCLDMEDGEEMSIKTNFGLSVAFSA
jgi:hypothetical protein